MPVRSWDWLGGTPTWQPEKGTTDNLGRKHTVERSDTKEAVFLVLDSSLNRKLHRDLCLYWYLKLELAFCGL